MRAETSPAPPRRVSMAYMQSTRGPSSGLGRDMGIHNGYCGAQIQGISFRGSGTFATCEVPEVA